MAFKMVNSCLFNKSINLTFSVLSTISSVSLPAINILFSKLFITSVTNIVFSLYGVFIIFESFDKGIGPNTTFASLSDSSKVSQIFILLLFFRISYFSNPYIFKSYSSFSSNCINFIILKSPTYYSYLFIQCIHPFLLIYFNYINKKKVYDLLYLLTFFFILKILFHIFLFYIGL